MKDPVDPDDGRTAWLKVANGIMWCLILIGVGSCYRMSQYEGPLVLIKVEKIEK